MRKDKRPAGVRDRGGVQHHVTRLNPRHEVGHERRQFEQLASRRQHDGLRAARRATGEPQTQRSLRVAIDLARTITAAGRTTDHLADVVEGEREIYAIDLLCVAEHSLHCCEIGLHRQISSRVLRMQRDPDEACLRECVVDDHDLDAIRQQHTDVTPGRQASGQQVVGQSISGTVELEKRHLAVAADERDAVGVVECGSSDQLTDLHGRSPCRDDARVVVGLRLTDRKHRMLRSGSATPPPAISYVRRRCGHIGRSVPGGNIKQGAST